MHTLISAKEQHLEQIGELISFTGYFSAMAKHNTLGLHHTLFIRDYIAKPLLQYTTIIVDSENEHLVLAMIICGTKRELIPPRAYGAYLPQKIAKMFDLPGKFEQPDNYSICMMSVAKNMRRQGLGRKLIEYAEIKAKKYGYDGISLSVWSCQTEAIKFYLDMEMMITNVINRSETLPFPLLLHMEKSSQIMLSHNYFETKAYSSLNLLD